MSTTVVHERFITLPDAHGLQASVVALEEHGFSVEVVGDLDTPRARRCWPESRRLVGDDQHLGNAGRDWDRRRDQRWGGPWDLAQNKMFALDFATQAQEMKAIGGQPDYALGSVHAVTGT